ncbi:MAG: YdcF family protein [Clostridia bacterium]|nr:YdcF family protein [Clostridia bacterium]
MKRIVTGILGGAAGFIAVTAAAYMPFVISEARKKHNDKCDYLLILGGNVIGADTPSPQLFERMKAAAEYLNENKKVVAIPCGGCFRENQKKSEARIIADYLISQGIEESRIILEDKSTTTYENFEFGTQIMKNHSGKELSQLSVAFLSSDYHIYRASVIAKQSGIANCGKVSCPTPGKAMKRFAREYIVAYEMFYKALTRH